jgi:hypothetical protein
MSRWRRRLVRGTVLAAVGGVTCAAALAYQLTGSSAVRQQVTSYLRKYFVGGEVALGSAKFRLFGGINVENFTLYRRDDPSRSPMFHVPAGVIYHDKEQLAHGKLAIRKLKMERPRLTLTRNADGQWNLAGILGPVHPELQIPIMEIEQGTVVVEMAMPAGPPGTVAPTPYRVELRNVNATLVNQPRPILNIQIHGDAVALGPVHMEGTWHRTEARLNAMVDVAPVPVTTALVRDLARFTPGLADQLDVAAGTGQLHAGVVYHRGAEPAWHHQVRIELTDGRLVHRALPLPLDDMTVSARCDDGVLAIDRLTAKAGTADVGLKCQLQPFASGVASAPHVFQSQIHGALTNPRSPESTPHPATLIPAALDPVRSMELTVNHLAVDPALFTKLPLEFQKYDQIYAPNGPLDLAVRLDRTSGPAVLKAKLRADGMTGRFEQFRYPLREVRGTLDLTMTAGRPPRLDVDLTGEANGRRPVTIQGRVEGDGPAPPYTMTVCGDGIAIDRTLVDALPAKFQAVARSYHPRGACDVTARLIRKPGELRASQQFNVGFRGDLTVCYDLFPVPLDRLTGSLDIALGPDLTPAGQPNWVCTFNEIRGGYAGARVVISGKARPTTEGTRVDLTLTGRNVPLDDTLAAAFANPRMNLRPIWEMFHPGGRFDFTAEVNHTDRQPAPADYDIFVRHAGATIRPTFFPLELTGLSGSFRLTRGHVEIGPYVARHGPTRLALGGGYVQFGEGWHFADLHDLKADPLPMDAPFVAALPHGLQLVHHALEPAGTLTVDLDRLVIDHPPELPGPAKPPVVYWDGRVTFADATLHTGVAWTGVTGQIASQGRYRGQLFDGVKGHISLAQATVFNQPLAGLEAEASIIPEQPNVLRLGLGRGQLYGGRLSGEGRVEFGAGLDYKIDLKAIGVRLEDIARQNHIGKNAQLNGLAKAELYLHGTGNGANELEGGGNVHVPNGRMYNLPLVLDLMKPITALHVPDGTAFEEAHAEFQIHGKQVQVQRLDLLGSAISLGGKGEMDLDGSHLAMDFYAVWGHVAQMLPAGVRDVPSWLSKNLLLLEARGQLGGQMTVRPKPVPALVDPVRQLVDRARGRSPGVKNQASGVRAQSD